MNEHIANRGEPPVKTAAAMARERLERYLDEKLSGAGDDEKWRFYTELLEDAKRRPVDRSGYESLAYQRDYEEYLAGVRRYNERRFAGEKACLPRRRLVSKR
ncbi:MAG: hypothetical protein LBQ35_06280 [Spirochaetaceae bacterium]|jgi:hypothetical protein|nr:hypothetical protein [Spirochaetaceae bacterium]